MEKRSILYSVIAILPISFHNCLVKKSFFDLTFLFQELSYLPLSCSFPLLIVHPALVFSNDPTASPVCLYPDMLYMLLPMYILSDPENQLPAHLSPQCVCVQQMSNEWMN